MNRRRLVSPLRSLRHRSPRNRGNMAAARTQPRSRSRTNDRAKEKRKAISPFTCYAASVPDPHWFSTGRIQGATKAREKSGEGTRIHHRPRSTFLSRGDSIFRTASHAIDRVDDDCHSSSATTPKLRRGEARRGDVTPIRERCCCTRETRDRWYAGRRSHRRAATRRHTPHDTRRSTASRGRVAPLFSLARARRPRLRAAAVAGSRLFIETQHCCVHAFPRAPGSSLATPAPRAGSVFAQLLRRRHDTRRQIYPY